MTITVSQNDIGKIIDNSPCLLLQQSAMTKGVGQKFN